jgi:hypothetical protein
MFELGSKPFISKAGPPQFKSGVTAPEDVVAAAHVTIQNCFIGLSSHHGVHGNNNDGVVLKNLRMQDFEVGGIHLNGASNVVIQDVNIGPSLKKTFGAQLSHAIFLDHLMNTLLMAVPSLREISLDVPFVLRDQQTTVKDVFTELHVQLQEYLNTGEGALKSVFGSGDILPDGSAIYGIVLHKKGPAVADFGACPFLKAKEDGLMESNITLANVNIHDLELNVDQWTRLVLGGKQVMGPAGDVFRFRQVINNLNGRYRGNPLSDAQIAVGHLKKKLLEKNIEPDEVAWYFGGTHMPDEVLRWATGQDSWWDIHAEGATFECFGDAMSHVNKGVVGLRLAYLKDAAMSEVHISSLKNIGTMNEGEHDLCVKEPYQGMDVFGAVITNSEELSTAGIHVDEESLESKNGGQTVKISLKRT